MPMKDSSIFSSGGYFVQVSQPFENFGRQHCEDLLV